MAYNAYIDTYKVATIADRDALKNLTPGSIAFIDDIGSGVQGISYYDGTLWMQPMSLSGAVGGNGLITLNGVTKLGGTLSEDTAINGGTHFLRLNNVSEFLVDSSGTGIKVDAQGVSILLGATSPIRINGDPGTAGQVLISQGDVLPPVWGDMAGGAGGSDTNIGIADISFIRSTHTDLAGFGWVIDDSKATGGITFALGNTEFAASHSSVSISNTVSADASSSIELADRFVALSFGAKSHLLLNGDPGAADQYIASAGPNLPPVWKTLPAGTTDTHIANADLNFDGDHVAEMAGHSLTFNDATSGGTFGISIGTASFSVDKGGVYQLISKGKDTETGIDLEDGSINFILGAKSAFLVNGSPGTPGQMLVSQGPDLPMVWGDSDAELIKFADATTQTNIGYKLKVNGTSHTGANTINLMITGDAVVDNAIYLPNLIFNRDATLDPNATASDVFIAASDKIDIIHNHSSAAFLGLGTFSPKSARTKVAYLGNLHLVEAPHRALGTVFSDDIGPNVITAINSSNRGLRITVNNAAVYTPYSVGDPVRLTDTIGSWHVGDVLDITGDTMEIRIHLTDIDISGRIEDIVVQRITAGNAPFSFNNLEILARSTQPAEDGRVEVINRDTFSEFVEDVVNTKIYPGELVLVRDINNPANEGWKLRQNLSQFIGSNTINLMQSGHARIDNALYIPDLVVNMTAGIGTGATLSHGFIAASTDVNVNQNHTDAAFLGLHRFTTNAARDEVVYMGNVHIVRDPHRADGSVYGTRTTLVINSKVANVNGGTDLSLASAPAGGQGFDVGDTIRITDSVGSRHRAIITTISNAVVTVDINANLIDDTANKQMIAEDIDIGNAAFTFDNLEILGRSTVAGQQGRVEVVNRDTFSKFVGDIIDEQEYAGMLIRERSTADPTKEGYKVRFNSSTIIGAESINLTPGLDAPLDNTLYTPVSIISDSKFKSTAAVSDIAVLAAEAIHINSVHSYTGVIGINGGAAGWAPHTARSEALYAGNVHIVREPHRDLGTIYVDPIAPGEVTAVAPDAQGIQVTTTAGAANLGSYNVGSLVRLTDTAGAYHRGQVRSVNANVLVLSIAYADIDVTGNIGDVTLDIVGTGNRVFAFDNLELLARSNDANDDGRIEVVNKDTFTKFVEDVVTQKASPGEFVLVRDTTDPTKEGYKLRENPTTTTGQHTINLKNAGDAPIDDSIYVPSVVLTGDVDLASGKTLSDAAVIASSDISITENLDHSAIIGINGGSGWGPSAAKSETLYTGNLNIVRQPALANFNAAQVDHTLDQAQQRTSGQNVVVVIPGDVNALYHVGDHIRALDTGGVFHMGTVVGKSLSQGTNTHTEVELGGVPSNVVYRELKNLTPPTSTRMPVGNMELLARGVNNLDGEVRAVSQELFAEFGKAIPIENIKGVNMTANVAADGDALVYHSATSDWRPAKIEMSVGDIKDVTLPTRGAADGETLVYRSATNDWRPEKAASGVTVSTTVPDAAQQDEGTLFFNPDTGKLYIAVANVWIQINA